MWFLPDLFIGLFYWTGTHGQHDGPSLGCGDGDDHHSGQDQDVYLENQEVKSKTLVSLDTYDPSLRKVVQPK